MSTATAIDARPPLRYQFAHAPVPNRFARRRAQFGYTTSCGPHARYVDGAPLPVARQQFGALARVTRR